MKNIHILLTDKPSRLHKIENQFGLTENPSSNSLDRQRHIYITSDEEIKEGFYGLIGKEVGKIILTEEGYEFLIGKGVSYEYGDFHSLQKVCKKIILTTDQDLIKDGVQAIDDEFLEWFVKNLSCEWVETVFNNRGITGAEKILKTFGEYKIIIPKEEDVEEPKQETLEEVAERLLNRPYGNVVSKSSFIAGAKWQAERMYSEEDMKQAFLDGMFYSSGDTVENVFEEWFKQFKKK